jgi:glutathione S-transferase
MSASEAARAPRFTLYGSPHSLPTYKVALMLRLSDAPFAFRYVSFQKAVHKRPEFRALSRWGQVPVLVDLDRVMVQSAAIVVYLTETLGRFRAPDRAALQTMREWLCWNQETLSPAVYGCYSVELDRRKLLKLDIAPAIAEYDRERAERALANLDAQLAGRDWLCAAVPTAADLFCYGDVAFAEICAVDLARWPKLVAWAARIKALPGFQAPFDLLQMADAEIV